MTEGAPTPKLTFLTTVTASVDAPVPTTIPANAVVEEGEIYCFTQPVKTRGDKVHSTGEYLLVLARSECDAFGEMGPNGCTWTCQTKHEISRWATLEACIDRGMLKRVTMAEVLAVPDGKLF